ncbi:hypothetical protein ES705_41947 [subsurface metagenome]
MAFYKKFFELGELKELGEFIKMAELKKIKLALKIALRRNKQLFDQGRNWESFDTFINLLLSIMENFGYTKEQVIAIYEDIKKEVEEERF